MSRRAVRCAVALMVAVLLAPADGANGSEGGWVAVKRSTRTVARKPPLQTRRTPMRAMPPRRVARHALSARQTALLPESGWQARSGGATDRPAALPPSGAAVPRDGAALRSREAVAKPQTSQRPNVALPDLDAWSTANARRAYRRAEQAADRSAARAYRRSRATSSGFDHYFDVRGFDRARRVPIRRLRR